jgi:hypothetical protein
MKINMKKQQFKAGVASMLVGVLAPVALLVPSVNAATITWSGSTSNLFNVGTNWVGSAVPTTGDTAEFGIIGGPQNLNNNISSLSLAKLVFNGANPGISATSYSITGNGLTITSGIDAIMTGSGGDHAVKTNVTLGANATFVTSGTNTLQVGDTGRVLNLATYNLTLKPDGGTITLAGEIDGSGKLIVNGTGKINMLAKPATGYTGAIEITRGEFVTNTDTEGNVVVNGGTLKGTSENLNAVSMSSGRIAPGTSPGCMSMDSLTLTGGTFQVELNGDAICTGHDQITVLGAVNLGSATTLEVSRLSSYAPAVNKAFPIILVEGTDPASVQGTFLDRPDGSKFTVDGYTYQINYNAGDGNDIFLLVTGTPSAPDTGVGSILTSPFTALLATMAALGVVGGLKFVELRRK